MELEHIAKICHEANKAYCETLGDKTQVAWEQASVWQKESAVNGVKFVFKNPTAGPSASHDSWLKEKRETGWKYGPVKDADKKEHPCFVPYQELPIEQRRKDFIFTAVAIACLYGEDE